MREEQCMSGVLTWARFLTGSLAVSRLAHRGEEGKHDGAGLEHLPQEERLGDWALSLLGWRGHWGHP